MVGALYTCTGDEIWYAEVVVAVIAYPGPVAETLTAAVAIDAQTGRSETLSALYRVAGYQSRHALSNPTGT